MAAEARAAELGMDADDLEREVAEAAGRESYEEADTLQAQLDAIRAEISKALAGGE